MLIRELSNGQRVSPFWLYLGVGLMVCAWALIIPDPWAAVAWFVGLTMAVANGLPLLTDEIVKVRGNRPPVPVARENTANIEVLDEPPDAPFDPPIPGTLHGTPYALPRISEAETAAKELALAFLHDAISSSPLGGGAVVVPSHTEMGWSGSRWDRAKKSLEPHIASIPGGPGGRHSAVMGEYANLGGLWAAVTAGDLIPMAVKDKE